MMFAGLDSPALGRLAVTLAGVITLFVLGHLIPLPGTAEFDPFVETGLRSGCTGIFWIQCWSSYPLPTHRQFANALWVVPIALLGTVWAYRRLTKRTMIRETER
jgi:hypothetical protein